MNTSRGQLSVEAQLFSKLSLFPTIPFVVIGVLSRYLILAHRSPTTLILMPFVSQPSILKKKNMNQSLPRKIGHCRRPLYSPVDI